MDWGKLEMSEWAIIVYQSPLLAFLDIEYNGICAGNSSARTGIQPHSNLLCAHINVCFIFYQTFVIKT